MALVVIVSRSSYARRRGTVRVRGATGVDQSHRAKEEE